MGNDQRRTSLVSPNSHIIIIHFHSSNNCSTLTITPIAEYTKLVSDNFNTQTSQNFNFLLQFPIQYGTIRESREILHLVGSVV